ncbi:NIN-like transcription factor [Trema orientale]|uniref:NIN-like transcription factor n=1 Tax=Trema orientale TaxID=63057 RepID=A0A221I0P5_TREOI|nr:nin-like protein 1 [Trema orientale]POO00892.1 NIN-like transcription factor [Trema orientale]
MEDGVLSPATILGAPADYPMDLDFMDELFLEGCWLETRDGSEFLNQNPPSSSPLFDPLFWPTLEPNGESNANPSPKSNQEERHRSLFIESQGKSPLHTLPPPWATTDVVKYSGVSEAHITEGSSELSRRWWIGPKANPGPSSSVMERLWRALMYIKDVIRDKDILVQIWVPVHEEGRRVLTTRDLPFALDDNSSKLARYRDISVKYQFSAEEDSKELVLGLPGRVFSGKVPEWTPDVRFFRNDEYPRLIHAQQNDVRGTLALPIFELDSRTCLGVVEIVMTTQKIKYRPELESVCKALEAVDLKSSEVLSTQNVFNKYYQAAIPEIQQVLRSACDTHRLPLAQTWVPCIYQGKEGCRHSDENYGQCVSTVDHACYALDPQVQSFHEACSEHHLFRGQGVVGLAFMTNQPCFSADITSYTKTEYPLSHHARMFRLQAAVAIRLRSIHTGAADFVLEFFLPVDCKDPEEQKKMLTSLSLIIQQCCQSLRVITDKELEEESGSRVDEVVVPSNPRPARNTCFTEAPQNDTDLSLFPEEKKPREISDGRLSKLSDNQRDSILKPSVDCVEECSTVGEGSFSSVGVGKTGERRRTKAEKTITLQVLRQYFAGSLKDAAKSIGVCSTTLKRICRQHGIKRWPSRKIKKVGHSLQKLQLVIDSVQGASGAFQIDSFYTNFPELASPNVSGTSPFSTSKPNDHPMPSNMQPGDGGIFSVQAATAAATSKSSSSCSQSSSSSHCCSSRSQLHPQTWNNVTSSDDLIAGESSGGGDDVVLKRVRSEAGLNACSEDGRKLLPRSQSHKSLMEHHKTEKWFPPSSAKNNNNGARIPQQQGEFQKVKVTYGEDRTRFRMQNNWGFIDLQQEVGRRFGIQDMVKFTLKYLDDDSEWVLLTCDADLEECFEVYRSSQNATIKLSLQPSRHLYRGCLRGNDPL